MMTLQTAKILKRLFMFLLFLAVMLFAVPSYAIGRYLGGAAPQPGETLLVLRFLAGSLILGAIAIGGLKVCWGAEQCAIERRNMIRKRLDSLFQGDQRFGQLVQLDSNGLPPTGRSARS